MSAGVVRCRLDLTRRDIVRGDWRKNGAYAQKKSRMSGASNKKRRRR
jgi:hypothetical protein